MWVGNGRWDEGGERLGKRWGKVREKKEVYIGSAGSKQLMGMPYCQWPVVYL